MPVSRECAAWGMRMLLGVEPRDDAGLEEHRGRYRTLEELREAFLRTPEARRLYAAANANVPGVPRPGRFLVPPHLLRRPDDPAVPWRFEEPHLEQPGCQLCTSEQMTGPLYRDLCGRLGQDPLDAHRKQWEYAFILAALRARGMLAEGRRGLGFGTGREPLPSALAAAGVAVTATDAPDDLPDNALWDRSGQWTHDVAALWHPGIVERETFEARVVFRPADMNSIPADLRSFDFCWSSCCLEHLGSMERGLAFLRNSLDTLRPGGVAVHTTEFNLSSDAETLESPNLSLFRKRDIEQGLARLVAEGHRVEPLNLWPGTGSPDEHVDLPPYGLPHLKLEFDGYAITSIGLIVTKAL